MWIDVPAHVPTLNPWNAYHCGSVDCMRSMPAGEMDLPRLASTYGHTLVSKRNGCACVVLNRRQKSGTDSLKQWLSHTNHIMAITHLRTRAIASKKKKHQNIYTAWFVISAVYTSPAFHEVQTYCNTLSSFPRIYSSIFTPAICLSGTCGVLFISDLSAFPDST
jgi:hypothetical protein